MPIDWDTLRADRAGLGRVDTVDRVAGILRTRILSGAIPAGTRLSEESIGAALDISRNTLREALRLLSHERLVVRRFNRGAFVRELTVADLQDIARLRRIIECGAVRELSHAPPGAVAEVGRAAERGRAAAASHDWGAVTLANFDFHQAIAGLAGSARVDEVFQRVLTEYRLAFVVVASPEELHAPYVERNTEIHRLLAAGETVRGEAELDRYLHEAERQLIVAFEGRAG